jgi:hypothetical protein
MQIPSDLAIRLQSRLREYASDISTCAFFIQYPTSSSAFSSVTEWQTAVDAIYRCTKSGLISVWHFGLGCNNENSFLESIRTRDPFDPDDDGLVWNGLFLCGTDRLTDLIARHFANPDDHSSTVNNPFIDELARIFEDAGVPWSSEPLLPVLVDRNTTRLSGIGGLFPVAG